MHFMLLCSINEQEWERVPAGERDQLMAEYGTLLQHLAADGRLKAGAKLQPIATAKTIRGGNGKTVLVDGPYAEAKEHLGGFHLIECKDMAEALAIAKRIPPLKVGSCVEVRPVEFMEPPA
jgi:hypothetical protein